MAYFDRLNTTTLHSVQCGCGKTVLLEGVLCTVTCSNVSRDCTVVSVVSFQKGHPLDWIAELNLESIRWFEAVGRVA